MRKAVIILLVLTIWIVSFAGVQPMCRHYASMMYPALVEKYKAVRIAYGVLHGEYHVQPQILRDYQWRFMCYDNRRDIIHECYLDGFEITAYYNSLDEYFDQTKEWANNEKRSTVTENNYNIKIEYVEAPIIQNCYYLESGNTFTLECQ